MFKNYKIIIYENDSTDNTFKILNEFKLNYDNVYIISEKNVHLNKSRTFILAHCRNTILDNINNLDTKHDYFINMDLDNVNLYLNEQTLKNIIETSSFDWAVLTANQTIYYDYWALRTNKYDKNCNIKGGACKIGHMNLFTWFDKKEHKKFINNTKIKPNSDPIKVISAFGGLAIYKLNKITDCRYIGGDDCEHVPFHKCIINKNKGPIYIVPKLINS
jgi:hypothetical protein